jgi:serine/threonine protein kinase
VISYLHASHILHRDIKSSNVLLEPSGLLKISDLGMCRYLSTPSERPRTTAGTLSYMAPELANEAPYSMPVDIWALGCVMYEICALKPAFTAFTSKGVVTKITSGRMPMIPREYSEELRQAVRAMMWRDEEKRPTAEEILELPFLQVCSSLSVDNVESFGLGGRYCFLQVKKVCPTHGSDQITEKQLSGSSLCVSRQPQISYIRIRPLHRVKTWLMRSFLSLHFTRMPSL